MDVLEFFYLNRIMCSLSISIFQCPNVGKTAINNLNVKQFPKWAIVNQQCYGTHCSK